jgi:polygalacturonase
MLVYVFLHNIQVKNSSKTDPYAWRPFMVRIAASTGVVVHDITLLDPGFWCIVPTHSDNIRVENV